MDVFKRKDTGISSLQNWTVFMYMISYEAIMLNGICLNCRVTLKSESGTEIKRKWKQEMVKSGEAVLVEKFVSMGEIPENAMLSFQIQMLM